MAFDDDAPQVDADELIDHILARAREEHARQSDAAESGAKIKELIEETRMNSQAYSWLKTILKKRQKKDGDNKALDIIRSREICLPMLKQHITGQGTPDMFPDDEKKDDAVVPFDPSEAAAD